MSSRGRIDLARLARPSRARRVSAGHGSLPSAMSRLRRRWRLHDASITSAPGKILSSKLVSRLASTIGPGKFAERCLLQLAP